MTRIATLTVTLAAVSLLAASSHAALITGVSFPSEVESNNLKATANLLQPDGDASPLTNAVGVTGAMNSSDTDWFTFMVDVSGHTSGAVIRMTYGTSQNNRNISWVLYDASDTQRGSLSGTINSSNPTRNINVSGLTSGQYWVRATSSSSSSNYNFMVEGLNGAAVSVVPEPASLALMGLGGLLMLGRGRRESASRV